jgi:hypothetical protein
MKNMMHRMAEGRAHSREIDMLLEITYVAFPLSSPVILPSVVVVTLLVTPLSWLPLIQCYHPN